jgi:hypothetical protein
MFLKVVSTNRKLPAIIELVVEADYKTITKKRYSFNWKPEKAGTVYKLTAKGYIDILGLMSLTFFENEQRIEIKLLAVVAEQIGKNKQVDRIAGNLIAFAGRLAYKKYGPMAAISLIPKTELQQHYMNKYGFEQAGISLFMEGSQLINLLNDYDYD